uniref:Uncharacterized protein n=1 Tax=Vibrio genomosp. F6 TaxID=723172 RepID=A0A0H3ZMR8_9VIBR|nr:hypothetical protein [Vibrio genomosp. F6]
MNALASCRVKRKCRHSLPTNISRMTSDGVLVVFGISEPHRIFAS